MTTSDPSWLFREDSFDPVTRIRRGRLYRYNTNGLHDFENTLVRDGSPLGTRQKLSPSAAFEAYFPVEDGKDVVGPLTGAQLEIGVAPFLTTWRVVGIEGIPAGAAPQVLLTLKAISSLGALPELKEEIVAENGTSVDRGRVQEQLSKLVEALHRQQAEPIVDVCRETARWILAKWLDDRAAVLKRQDLKDLLELAGGSQILQAAGKVVNGLHARGKSSTREERAVKGQYLRPPIDEDADLSVRLVGFILRDIGWAAA